MIATISNNPVVQASRLHDSTKRTPPLVETYNVTKRFGSFVALDTITTTILPCSFHALLGENGAGKSTLVKCIMGCQKPDGGSIMIDKHEVDFSNPRDAQAYGIGMVYQHFTLVPNMTVLENFVLARAGLSAVVDWKSERKRLDQFFDTMPFRVEPSALVKNLAAGQKQKVEILKQLYLDTRMLILDEPTSVLTPDEAAEILGMIRKMTRDGVLSALLITHKLKQVMDYADEITVLRRGKFAGRGLVKDLTPDAMADMMVGGRSSTQGASRTAQAPGPVRLEIENLSAHDETGKRTLKNVSLKLRSGEIAGIAGVSGNGQRELVEVIAGQRRASGGHVRVNGERFSASRKETRKHKLFCLPEEPLKNACAPNMTVTENLALRNFDRAPISFGKWLLSGRALLKQAHSLIERFRVRTPSPHASIGQLSGGNVQRAVLARELSGDVEILIAANPVFGLDFGAVADIHRQLIEARNRGAAVLLVSEDLDELFELSDRLLVMFGGEIVHETPIESAQIRTIGSHMAGMSAGKAHVKESHAQAPNLSAAVVST
ncbi:MAG TPA: ABC transporter ATP-binding protein [Planctomycetota bacterium]|nr:ABC transporter ATP-binding protein [Planctomycetota bacterium]